MKVVIAGASGFLGRALVRAFVDADLVALDRSSQPVPGVRSVVWDGKSQGAWASELEGADAVINLAGAPVTMRWTPANRALIRSSRIDSTAAIASAIDAAQVPPRVWVNSSAVGYYGESGEATVTEASPAGKGFLSEVCVDWESAQAVERGELTRLVRLRTGIVLGKGGGALPKLEALVSRFLGGAAGSGSQWVPWIEIQDYCRLVQWCVDGSVAGPVNACAPGPARNLELMAEIRRASRRPWAPPVPVFALLVVGKLLGPDAETVLTSTRAVPEVAVKGGFQFEFPTLEQALGQSEAD